MVTVPGTDSEAARQVSVDSIIRWENRDDGVFRIIDSKLMAQLWGRRKHNSTMTYEKLSRALRLVDQRYQMKDETRDKMHV